MDDLQCVRFEDCGGVVPDQGSYLATVAKARARDWHVFDGHTLGGKEAHVVLCAKCVGTPRSRLPLPPKVLEGQEELF
jgi:hypothetical protein